MSEGTMPRLQEPPSEEINTREGWGWAPWVCVPAINLLCVYWSTRMLAPIPPSGFIAWVELWTPPAVGLLLAVLLGHSLRRSLLWFGVGSVLFVPVLYLTHGEPAFATLFGLLVFGPTYGCIRLGNRLAGGSSDSAVTTLHLR
jgi:hypothetical protein